MKRQRTEQKNDKRQCKEHQMTRQYPEQQMTGQRQELIK